jgi:hypothetical protein
MRFRTVAAVALSVSLVLAALISPRAGASPIAQGTVPFSEATPANVVILADESGSIDLPGELPGERQAAAEIASAAWAKGSQVAIYGFGSAPPHEAESAAVDKICGLIPVASQQDIAALDNCASRIAVRPPDAWNTDFNAALTVAGQVLAAQGAAGQGRVPLVFMLTDGRLDLGNQAATAAAQQQLSGSVLPSLANQHIEIWPVGFGAADMSKLNAIAAGGAQTNSSCPAGTGAAPQATPVPAVTGEKETEQIQQQLLKAFAAASCATTEPGQWRVLQPGQSVNLNVVVNPLTTLGSIIINKGSPAVTVTYTDPDHGHVSDVTTTRPSGRLDGYTFDLSSSGPMATQEALRLDYPVPGQWAVTFYNPTPHAQVVGTQVLWQGQVTPDITFSPTTGESGRQVRVLVTPALDARPVPAADLAPLRVAVTVQWQGDGTEVAVPVTFDAADGRFTGPVTVPAGKSGNALVTATVQGTGVTGAATATLGYQPGGGLGITVTIPPGTRVDPGGTLTANADFTNLDNTRQPVTHVEFLLSGLGGTGNASIVQSRVTIGSGNGSVPVTIHVGKTRGPIQGVIDWEVAGTTVQHPAGSLDISIEPPPPWYTQWWLWTLLAVVVLAGAGLFTGHRIKAARKHRDGAERQRAEDARWAANRNVRDAGVALLRKDAPGDTAFLRWTGPAGEVYERWFDVKRSSGKIPRLVETTHKKSGRFLLTRTAEHGVFRLTVPDVVAPPLADGTGNGASAGAAISHDPPPGSAGPGVVSGMPAANGNGPDDAAEPAAGNGTAPIATPDIQVDLPFDPPPGADLDGCMFLVTLGDTQRVRLPDPRLREIYDEDDAPVGLTTGPGSRDEEFERPDPTVYDDFTDFDEHGGAGGSGAQQI